MRIWICNSYGRPGREHGFDILTDVVLFARLFLREYISEMNGEPKSGVKHLRACITTAWVDDATQAYGTWAPPVIPKALYVYEPIQVVLSIHIACIQRQYSDK